MGQTTERKNEKKKQEKKNVKLFSEGFKIWKAKTYLKNLELRDTRKPK